MQQNLAEYIYQKGKFVFSKSSSFVFTHFKIFCHFRVLIKIINQYHRIRDCFCGERRGRRSCAGCGEGEGEEMCDCYEEEKSGGWIEGCGNEKAEYW